MSRDIYILPGLRSPFCKVDRELAARNALELSVPVAQQSVSGARGPGPNRSGSVDLVLWGSVVPSLAVSNWGREVWLEAGLERHVPAQTIVQACGTTLAAATHAAGQIGMGAADLVLCGGVESISNAQVGLSEGLSRAIRRAPAWKGPGDAFRTLGAIRPKDLRIAIPAVTERVTGKSMGEHCEEMASHWGIPRDEQDRFALASHTRAVQARESGFFRPLLVSAGTYAVDTDTVPRPDTTLGRLAELPPAFDENGTLTAGNSSPLTDGAACCWVASSEGAGRLPSELPRVRLVDWEQAAVDPAKDGLLMAPALAIPRLLARQRLGFSDVSLWEFHEAFAAQVLCTFRALESREWTRERARVESNLGDFPRDRVNPNGGSVALGHPFAATGARLLSQTATELAGRAGGTRAVVSICAAGGLGHVALLEAA